MLKTNRAWDEKNGAGPFKEKPSTSVHQWMHKNAKNCIPNKTLDKNQKKKEWFMENQN